MQNLKEAFGKRIKELRKSRNMTQEELAEFLSLNPRQLTRIEAGENFPSAESLAKLCCALDIDMKYLFDFEWNKEITLLSTGTDDLPVIKLVEKNNKMNLKTPKDKVFEDAGIGKEIPAAGSEAAMINMAKRLNKPLTVEHFNDKKRKYVKTYYPNGKSEVTISEKNIQAENIQNYVKNKMKDYSVDVEKLDFIKLAVDSLDSNEALNELKIFLKGMELAKKFSK